MDQGTTITESRDENNKKRSVIACIRCRKRHIKCDGTGPPCSKCASSKSECEYVEGEKKIVISMKYLNKLHNEIARLKIENANLRNAMKHGGESATLSDQDPTAISPKSAMSGGNKDEADNIEHLNVSSPLAEAQKEPSSSNPSSSKSQSSDLEAKDKKSATAGQEIIPPFLDKYGRMISSRTGERVYVGSSSMTLFGLEINRLVAPMMLNQTSLQQSASDSPDSTSTPTGPATEKETVLEREGNAYRIMLGKTRSRPGMNVNFTLPSYSYAMLLVDTFVSYNDGCFYFFNEGLVKENLRRIYNEDMKQGFKLDYGIESINNAKENDSILETIWFCKLLLIFAIGEMYLGTANNLNGYKISERPKKKKHKSGSDHKSTAKLPGSGFFNQASELFTGLFSSGAIDNCAREGGIEVLLLYAFYLQVADCTVASYFYFGLALRASLILGFHVDIGKDTLNRYELEHRRRLWWTVYMYERMLASKAGLPLSLTDDDISIDLPEDFDMSEPPSGCDNYIFPEAEFIRNCVKITQINANILRRLYTKQPSSNILPIVHELVFSLLKWKKSLPDYINCDYQQKEISITRLVVNMMTEYFQGVNLAVRPLLFHFVLLNLKSENPKHGTFLDLSKYSSVVLTLLNASFQASINTVRSLWALMPENMVALFGYMDREYLFTATATLVLFNSTFGVHEATLEHLDHALTMFTKMRNLGNHPATLRREQILKLMSISDFNGSMAALIKRHTDNLVAPTPDLNESEQLSGIKYSDLRQEQLHQQLQQHKQGRSSFIPPIRTTEGVTPPLFNGYSSSSATQKQQLLHSSNSQIFSLLNEPHTYSNGTSPHLTAFQSQAHLSAFRSTTTPTESNSHNNLTTSSSEHSINSNHPAPHFPFSPSLISQFNPNLQSSNNANFSPSLLPQLTQLEDVPNLETFVMSQNNSHDMELWKDITDQAAWLANGDNEDFSHLVPKTN